MVKSTVEISQNFVAFSEYMNFKSEANYNTTNTFSKFINSTISKLKVERLETHKTKIASLLVANRNNNSNIIDLNLVGLTQHKPLAIGKK